MVGNGRLAELHGLDNLANAKLPREDQFENLEPGLISESFHLLHKLTHLKTTRIGILPFGYMPLYAGAGGFVNGNSLRHPAGSDGLITFHGGDKNGVPRELV